MGILLSRCISRKKRSVVVMGSPGSGKTALISAMKKEQAPPEESKAIFSQHIITAKGYTLEIFDISGEKNHSQFWKFYTENSHIVVFVVDISSENKIIESKQVFETFYASSYCMQKENLVFILNKIESVPEEEREERIVKFHEEFGKIFGLTKRATERAYIPLQEKPSKTLSFICKHLRIK